MAIFLTREQVYRLLQRELPEFVYPDGAPSAFYSTADMDSIADCAATGYGNLERIYLNSFPQTAEERIDDWEVKVFGSITGSSLTLDERRTNLVNWLRTRKGITLWDILQVVLLYVPEGTYVQIFEDGGVNNVWRLGKSTLGIQTYLGLSNLLSITGEDACSIAHNVWRLGASYLGVNTYLGSNQSIIDQQQAYHYQIRIFDYEVTGDALEKMKMDINRFEPARSFHSIFQNLSLIAFGLIVDVPNVDQFSGVNCVAKDNTQSTGFKGKVV